VGFNFINVSAGNPGATKSFSGTMIESQGKNPCPNGMCTIDQGGQKKCCPWQPARICKLAAVGHPKRSEADKGLPPAPSKKPGHQDVCSLPPLHKTSSYGYRSGAPKGRYFADARNPPQTKLWRIGPPTFRPRRKSQGRRRLSVVIGRS